jgi:hypothetical protein
MSKYSDGELIFEIYRVKNKEGAWCPAVKDIVDHDITPLWIAGTAYAIFANYIDSIPESNQIEYEKQAFAIFKHMIKEGMKYIDRGDTTL